MESLYIQIHNLAYTYHFPPESLWDMPRNERYMWLSMPQKQMEYEQNKSTGSSLTNTKKYKESS
jgi:hypothetical protein